MPGAFEGWACVELFGHRVLYGQISEVTVFGEAFARIDIPTDPPTFELKNGKAIYGLRPVSEEAVRNYHRPRPSLATGADRDDGGFDDDDEPDERCGGCGKPIRFGEPTEQVTDDNEDVSTWHKECADACDPDDDAPADPLVDSDAPAPGFSAGLRVCTHYGITPNDSVVANRLVDKRDNPEDG